MGETLPNTLTDALQFYGVDWLAMVLTFIAIYLLGNKAKMGFPVMMMGNTCWMAVGVMTSSMAMVIANMVFFAMNLRALMRWHRDQMRGDS